jgi:uncharacterized MAPEG superfamily protein
MTAECRYLLLTSILTGCLWIPVIVGRVMSRGFIKPVDYKIAPTSPLPHWVNRANRAHINAVESLTPFAAVVLIGQAFAVSSSLCAVSAATFFFARLVHAVLHISGFSLFRARTVVFTIAWSAFMVFGVEVLRRAA